MGSKRSWHDEREDAYDDGDLRNRRKQRPARGESVRFVEITATTPEVYFPRTSSPGASAGPVNMVRAVREFFPATCAACGKSTTVPFKPTQGRPVHCRDCFTR